MFEENTITEEERIVAEALAEEAIVSEVTSKPIKFSAGVEFTAEEIEGMDPTLKEKLLKVKDGDTQWVQGMNRKVEEVKALKLELEAAKKSKPTPAPVKPTGTIQSGSTELRPTEVYLLRKMTEESYATARSKSVVKYGEAVVSAIDAKIGDKIASLVVNGKHETNFGIIYDAAFNELVSKDDAVFSAFSEYKTGVTAADKEAKAKQEAALKILQGKQTVVEGLPQGGSSVLHAPAEELKPRTLKEAKAKFHADMAKLKEKQ